ncbi:MAG: hypothetical protein M1475_04655 [Actinobacteria bacterium]|nr:hypothetical protein [Actinomycetota bacterium]
MKVSIKIYEVAYVKETPGPQIFWMSDWENKYKLSFQVMLIKGGRKNILINTGLTDELIPEVNKIWAADGNENKKLIKTNDIQIILRNEGMKPDDIDYVIITPLQHYTLGKIDIFKNAEICLSKKGWIDFHVSNYNLEPRELIIPSRILKYLIFDRWEKVKLLEDESYILPWISTFWCGCHHRSSIAIKIKTDNCIIIVTDAFFKLKNIEDNIPIGIAENIYECLDAYSRIKKEADLVISLYDSGNFLQFEDGIII